jgi:hypothetical protein
MMTQEEIITTIRQLPLEERVQLLEEISRSVQEELGSVIVKENQPRSSADREHRLAAFERLQGMLKADGSPPTDQELKDDYLNYLEKKYS